MLQHGPFRIARRAVVYHLQLLLPISAHVQLIPYRASSPGCHLNLPLSLYLVCKLIYNELPLLSSKNCSLDFVYIIKGGIISSHARRENPDGPRVDDDLDFRK